LRYEPAKKIDNVNKNSSLLQLFSHNSWDETSENIYQNHLSTIERGILENRKNIVVLEDDAEIILKPNKLKKLVKWLDNNEWDIFFLGHCCWPPISIYINNDILKPMYPLLAHAYVINGKSMQKVLNSFRSYKKTHFDKIFCLSKFNMYACFPSIAFQKKPPAIFKEISDRLNTNINFNSICYTTERLAIILPFIILFITVFILYRLIINIRKNYKK
jgi:hypothetical protein